MSNVLPAWQQRVWGFSRWSLGIGAGVTGLLWGFHWATQRFVTEQVVPNVQQTLAGSLGRRVDLGEVEFVYPWQVEFGPSQVEGLIQVEQIGVGVNLWRWLWTGEAELTLRLDQPQVTLQESAAGWLSLPLQPPRSTGSLPIQRVSVSIQSGELRAQPLQGSLAPVEGIEGTVHLELGTALQATGQVAAEWAGGHILGQIALQEQGWQGSLRGRGLALDQMGSWRGGLPLQAAEGEVNLELQWQPKEPLLDFSGDWTGWVRLNQVGLTVAGLPQPLSGVTGSLRLLGSRVHTESLGLVYGAIPIQSQGSLDWRRNTLAIQGVIAPQALATVAPTLGLPEDLPLTTRLQAQVGVSGSLDAPVLVGSFENAGATQLDRLALNSLRGSFRFQEGELSWRGLQIGLGDGVIRAEGEGGSLRWQGENLDPAGIAAAYGTTLPFQLGRLRAQGQWDLGSGQAQGSWTLAGGEITGAGALAWQQGQAALQGSATLPQGGTVAGQVRWDPQQVSGDLALSGIPLPAAAAWPGSFSGQVQGSVPTDNLTLGAAQIRAQGQVEVEGLGDPIQVAGRWDGSGIGGEAVHPWGRLQGRVALDPDRLQLGTVQAAWKTHQLPLADLDLPGEVAGMVTAAGTLSGSPSQLTVAGTAGIEHLQVAGVPFDPLLQGSLDWNQSTGEGQIDLRGESDRIGVRLGAQARPLQLVLKRGATLVSGRGDADRLLATITDLPVTWIAGIEPDLPPITGDLSGEVGWHWASQTATGTVTVPTLGLGGLKATDVQSQFQYQPRQWDLQDLSLTLVNSRYQMAGQVLLPSGQEPQVHLRLLTQQGSLEDWVQTFAWRDWQDLWERRLSLPQLGPASELEVNPLSVLGLALLQQIERYEQILAELAALAQEQSELRIPPLRSLRGQFQAQATLSGSLSDPQLTFDVQGQDWSVADRQTRFALDRVSAAGSLNQGTLTLAPLQLTYDNRSATFRGSLAPDQQQGSLIIESMPLTVVQPFLPRRIRLQGDVNLTADFSGSLKHPEITGQATLSNGGLNAIPLQSGRARFQYQNAQLNLDSTLQLSAEAPVRINGQIPLAIPFSQDAPNPNALNLSLKLENDGLELVNLLTTAARWEGEQEDLDLTIQGSLTNPTLLGSLTVKGGSLRLPQFPDPIQNIQGEIAFNADEVEVKTLTGTWQQGSLSAQGILPIHFNAPNGDEPVSQPLTLSLESLRLNTPLYQGQAQGSLTVHGRLLSPLIGGEVILTEGTFDLGNLAPLPEPVSPAGVAADDSGPTFQPEWNGLTLTLGSPADVRHPLFRFLAKGQVALFGPLDQPQPQGTITIERGQVNLFATAFRLDRSRRNTVTFDRTFDPLLDLRLVTQVTEFFRNTTTGLAFDANRNLPGSQQTIQVQAEVNGRVSALAQNDPRTNSIQLSSTPFRSRDEIIGLLGGYAIAGFAANNSLVGLAGSAFFFTVQDALVETLGLDDVRLGPVVQPNQDGSSSRFSVGLGLEVAKDLGPALSVSLQQNLTDPQAKTRYGLRYRLNDSLLLRVSTDLKGDSSLALEVETRF